MILSALEEPACSTNNAVAARPSTLIYLIMARQAIGRNVWPEKAFPTKESAEAYASTKNLAYTGIFYTVSPLMLASTI